MRRKLAELEAKLIEEEAAARITAAVEAKVAEALASEAVQQSLQRRLEEERAQLEQQVGRGGGPRLQGAGTVDIVETVGRQTVQGLKRRAAVWHKISRPLSLPSGPAALSASSAGSGPTATEAQRPAPPPPPLVHR